MRTTVEVGRALNPVSEDPPSRAMVRRRKHSSQCAADPVIDAVLSPVDAVRVHLEQDGDAVTESPSDLGGRAQLAGGGPDRETGSVAILARRCGRAQLGWTTV
jgi:hypothetical protein